MISAGLDSSRLTVALDLRHPLAYLALGPTRSFARDRGIAVNWLPLAVPPLNAPGEPGPDDDRGVRHRRYRAQAIAREIAVYAEAQGLVVRDPYRSPDPGAAHAAWLWVRDRSPKRLEDFLEGLFRDYWCLALDPADPGALAERVEAQGADGSAFRAWWQGDGSDGGEGEGAATLARVAGELRDFGLFQVPAYVVEDEVFYGRQHLPMIGWILDGRQGPGPI